MTSRRSTHHYSVHPRNIFRKFLTGMLLVSLTLALIMLVCVLKDSFDELSIPSATVTVEPSINPMPKTIRNDRRVLIDVAPFQPLPERVLNMIQDTEEPLGFDGFVPNAVHSRQIKLHHQERQLLISTTPILPHASLKPKKPVIADLRKGYDMEKVADHHNIYVKRTDTSMLGNNDDSLRHLNGVKNSQELRQMVEKRNAARLDRVINGCARFGAYWQKYMPQAEFYHSPDHKLLYCKVAKGGCTFWEQLFSFILRPESMRKDNYTSLYEIPRWRIHFDLDITPPALHWTNAERLSREKVTRFMFTRDPFSRIWSAYIDKIWLPDFWHWIRIKNHTGAMYTDRCLYDVSFADFVEYISSKSNSNKHWAPIHQSCNPCMFKPHILGNMSTFAEDAWQILSKGNLEFVLSQYNYEMRVRNELKMLVQYNYERLRNKTRLFTFCEFFPNVLAQRLWKAFQINGYISSSISFPRNLKEFDENSVLNAILKGVSQRPLTRKESSVQRKYFLRRAYQSVSRTIMDKMLTRFEPDFILFGFERHPDFLLQDNERPKPFDWR